MTKKIIVLGCDHAGYDLKENLKTYLKALRYNVDDLGTFDVESVDYPVFGKKVAELVHQDPDKYIGVLTCGTGIGMSIVANRFSGVRAALVYSRYMAELARKHNDANMLVFGATIVTEETARQCCDAFLHTEFDGGRHQRRIDQIN